MPDSFPMIADPWFYAAAFPAVLIIGLSKGGFGPGTSLIALPLLALVLPPLQAAAIMLPVLCAMDLAGLWGFRGKWDRRNMKIIIPGAMIGIVIGTLTAGYVSNRGVEIIVGAVAVIFALQKWLKPGTAEPTQPNTLKGVFWSACSGFTSFIAHAGGPPLQVYLLPQRLDKTTFVATTVVFFASVNYVKLIPYWWLGQFTPGNLATGAVLVPVAVGGVYLGMYLHHKLSDALFYRIVYIFVFLCGLKLLYDGFGLTLF
ncbi:sulfite exporter TauE/SafE family protein [Ferrovibrio terrae]|uniref:sulfite exporter TauE/SafE family protein n=1 Tax=Ferrovibrio terrae TaxID=2594003 RepID=UPI003137CF69